MVLGARRRGAVLAGAVTAARGARPAPAARPAAGTGGVVAVVAHPDDDLFFLNPDLLRDVRSGDPVTTVYLTSGDAGRGDRYWRGRERGVAAAWARMAGAADRWSTSRVAVGPLPAVEAVLDADPRVRLLFLRLPDGGMAGTGTPRSGRATLQRLVEGRAARVWTVETPARACTRDELVEALGRLLTGPPPRLVRTLDHAGPFGDGDHSDHHAAARLAVAARDGHAPGVPVVGYVGYPAMHLPANVEGEQLRAKADALAAYAAFDPLMYQSPEELRRRPEAAWLPRQHTVRAGTATAGGDRRATG